MKKRTDNIHPGHKLASIAQQLSSDVIPEQTLDPQELWMDKQDILQLLHISPRTLQHWRTKRILVHYKIRGKIFYKRSDVVAMLQTHIVKA
jgi:Helix-turn-helix domain